MIFNMISPFVLCVTTCILIYINYTLKEKSLHDKRYCKTKTKGMVVGYESRTRFGVNLPIVKYRIGNMSYKTVGPKYEFIIQNKFEMPWINQEILSTSDPMGKIFEYKRTSGAVLNKKINPMKELFPIGTEVDVFYDKFSPEDGCVLRYVDYTKMYRYICCFMALISFMLFIGRCHILLNILL